jgi:hypothetical protein
VGQSGLEVSTPKGGSPFRRATGRRSSAPPAAGSDRPPASLPAALPRAAWEPIRDKVLAASSLEPAVRRRSSACWSVTRVKKNGFAGPPADRAGIAPVSPSSRSRSGWSGRAAILKSGRMPAGRSSRRRSLPLAISCRPALRIWRCERARAASDGVCCGRRLRRWRIKPAGVYVDGTFGRGGHSRAILERLGRRASAGAGPRSAGGRRRARSAIHD